MLSKAEKLTSAVSESNFKALSELNLFTLGESTDEQVGHIHQTRIN